MGEDQPDIEKKVKDIDAKIKALEEKLNSGQMTTEDYIPQLLALFYDVEGLSTRSRLSQGRKLNKKAAIAGGVVGWLVFFVAFVFLAPLEFSLRANILSTTGLGPYQSVLNLISYSDMQSILLNGPFFVFLYYLIASVCTFPDLFTIAFPIMGGLVAGVVTQYFYGRRSGEFMIVGQRKLHYVRLDEGFIAGGVVSAVLTLMVLVVSALMYAQWLLNQGLVVDETTLPWGYLFRVFFPTLFTFHVTAGGAAGALGEVITSRKMSK